jgi:hypothetical protein
MAGLIGAMALTGRWPVDAPRTHVEAGGIFAMPAERITSVEIAEGDQHTVLGREPAGAWLVNGVRAGPAVATHIDTALRLLAVSAPRRVLTANDYGAGQLAEFGLGPAHFTIAVAGPGGNATRIGFGEATPAQNAQYVQIVAHPELYLLPRDVGEEWRLAHDMAERAPGLLLPVSMARIWAIEIVSHGVLYRFERDPSGLWFHHVGQHVHLPGGLVHHADPVLAPLIETELAALDRSPIAQSVARRPDAAALGTSGLTHPAMILLLYSRDSAGPVARVEFGEVAADGSDRYVHIVQSEALVMVPGDAARHLATLLQLAGASS